MSGLIADRLAEIKGNLGDACLIAVSKYHTIEDIAEAYDAGQRDFGESRVQDLLKKATHFADAGVHDIKWHFIGRLQTNKVNMLLKVPNLRFVHSIDSLKLLQFILDREENFLGEKLGLFLQLNTSDEAEKGGFRSVSDLVAGVDSISKLDSSKYYLEGLMTIGRIRTDDFEGDAKRSFNELRSLRDDLQSEMGLTDLKLSMGMSSDYKLAVEHGSSYVRVGSAIFGAY